MSMLAETKNIMNVDNNCCHDISSSVSKHIRITMKHLSTMKNGDLLPTKDIIFTSFDTPTILVNKIAKLYSLKKDTLNRMVLMYSNYNIINDINIFIDDLTKLNDSQVCILFTFAPHKSRIPHILTAIYVKNTVQVGYKASESNIEYQIKCDHKTPIYTCNNNGVLIVNIKPDYIFESNMQIYIRMRNKNNWGYSDWSDWESIIDIESYKSDQVFKRFFYKKMQFLGTYIDIAYHMLLTTNLDNFISLINVNSKVIKELYPFLTHMQYTLFFEKILTYKMYYKEFKGYLENISLDKYHNFFMNEGVYYLNLFYLKYPSINALLKDIKNEEDTALLYMNTPVYTQTQQLMNALPGFENDAYEYLANIYCIKTTDKSNRYSGTFLDFFKHEFAFLGKQWDYAYNILCQNKRNNIELFITKITKEINSNELNKLNDINSDKFWSKVNSIKTKYFEFKVFLMELGLECYHDVFMDFGIYSINIFSKTFKHWKQLYTIIPHMFHSKVIWFGSFAQNIFKSN